MASTTYLPDGGGPDYGGASPVIRAFEPPLPSGGPVISGSSTVSTTANPAIPGNGPVLSGSSVVETVREYPSDNFTTVTYSGGSLAYYQASGTVASFFDCEGRCCCRCTYCKGVGYWSRYDVIFPTVDSVWFMDFTGAGYEVNVTSTISGELASCFSGATHTIAADAFMEQFPYGSQGAANGECSYYKRFTCNSAFPPNYTDLYMFNYSQLRIFTPASYGGGPFVIDGALYPITSFDCRTGGVTSASPCAFGQTGFGGFGLSQCPTPASIGDPGTGTNTVAPNYPGGISIVPSASAVWRQCGQNSDGTPTDDIEIASIQNVNNVQRPTSLNIIVNKDRCDYFQSPGKKEGCGGWNCPGKCELNLVAIPGATCQTCDFYKVDPDYEGQGPKGWLST